MCGWITIIQDGEKCIYRKGPLQVNSASLLCLRRLFLTRLIDIDMIDRRWRLQQKTACELPPHLHYACRLQLHATAISPATHRSCAPAACTWNAQIHPSPDTVFKSQRINRKFNTCTRPPDPQIPFVISVPSPRHFLASFQMTPQKLEMKPPSFWSIKIVTFGVNQSSWHHWKLFNNKRLENIS